MGIISKVRRLLYGSARTLGDVQSLGSPRKYVHRKVRKFTLRKTFSLIRKITR